MGPPGRRGITVRTQWQSGPSVGNTGAGTLKGNRLIGNERQTQEKFHPYLSRKIYPACCRCSARSSEDCALFPPEERGCKLHTASPHRCASDSGGAIPESVKVKGCRARKERQREKK